MDKLKTWRLERGLSAEEAGSMFGVGRVQWFRMEAGARKVAADKVIQVESVTGISRHELRPDVFGPAPQSEDAA